MLQDVFPSVCRFFNVPLKINQLVHAEYWKIQKIKTEIGGSCVLNNDSFIIFSTVNKLASRAI